MLHEAIKLIYRIKCKIFTTLACSNFKHIGKNSTIELPFRSSGENRISIGANVFIGADSWIACLSDPSEEAENAAINIGNRCSISGHCTITAMHSVVIGESVLIARYAYISDHSHEFHDLDTPIRDQGTTPPASIEIKQGAWIGQSAVICPGVTIGKNSVVAANSVVKIDVPDNSVAAGSPARIVKTLK